MTGLRCLLPFLVLIPLAAHAMTSEAPHKEPSKTLEVKIEIGPAAERLIKEAATLPQPFTLQRVYMALHDPSTEGFLDILLTDHAALDSQDIVEDEKGRAILHLKIRFPDHASELQCWDDLTEQLLARLPDRISPALAKFLALQEVQAEQPPLLIHKMDFEISTTTILPPVAPGESTSNAGIELLQHFGLPTDSLKLYSKGDFYYIGCGDPQRPEFDFFIGSPSPTFQSEFEESYWPKGLSITAGFRVVYRF